jgi:hypothetical protein
VREIVSGEGELESAGAMTRGTAADACIVWVFCTFNWIVPGVAMLLLAIVPDKVLLSTAVVVSGESFQRMAAWAGKFVPMIFSVVD